MPSRPRPRTSSKSVSSLSLSFLMSAGIAPIPNRGISVGFTQRADRPRAAHCKRSYPQCSDAPICLCRLQICHVKHQHDSVRPSCAMRGMRIEVSQKNNSIVRSGYNGVSYACERESELMYFSGGHRASLCQRASCRGRQSASPDSLLRHVSSRSLHFEPDRPGSHIFLR